MMKKIIITTIVTTILMNGIFLWGYDGIASKIVRNKPEYKVDTSARNKPEYRIGYNSGDIIIRPTNTVETGFLECNGQLVSRTTYSLLFSVIGTYWGAGDGSTTFKIPDMRGRFPLGVAASGTGSTLGDTGGVMDHAHGSPITTGSPSATVAATILAGGAASTTHTHTVTLTAQNPPFIAVKFMIKT